jgi:hypothetical protein
MNRQGFDVGICKVKQVSRRLKMVNFFGNFSVLNWHYFFRVPLFLKTEIYNSTSNFTWSKVHFISIE